MDILTSALENCSLLRVLPPELVHKYYNEGLIISKSYGRNEILHLEGEACIQIEIVVYGQISIERIDESGKVLTVASFKIGDNLGANLLFSNNPIYPMSVISKERSDVLILRKDLIFELCKSHPEFLYQFLEVISDHAVYLGVKVKDHIRRTIRELIVAYINREYLIQHSSTIKMTVTKKVLAESLGVSRTSLSREMQKMKLENLIDYDSKTITILDKDLLN
jgi:CRP-like cAMP-binding protein